MTLTRIKIQLVFRGKCDALHTHRQCHTLNFANTCKHLNAAQILRRHAAILLLCSVFCFSWKKTFIIHSSQRINTIRANLSTQFVFIISQHHKRSPVIWARVFIVLIYGVKYHLHPHRCVYTVHSGATGILWSATICRPDRQCSEWEGGGQTQTPYSRLIKRFHLYKFCRNDISFEQENVSYHYYCCCCCCCGCC